MPIIATDTNEPTRPRITMTVYELLTALALVWAVAGLMMAVTGDTEGWLLMGAGLIAVFCVGMDRRVGR